MKDKRKALKEGTQFFVGNDKKVVVVNEVGRGANCIVYDACYIDRIGVTHKIRIKECYPDYLQLDRNMEGELIVSEDDSIRFCVAKKRFVESYTMNTQIGNTLGLANSTINANDLLQENQTYYAMMSFDEGTDYRDYTDPTLKKLFEHIRSLAELIKKYHENGYLHLDIKPENIFVIPETEEHILLFDFDSVVTVEELKKNAPLRLPFSDGFSAPEQIQGKVEKIGCHTDIYAIGAVVFYKIFGRTPTLEDCKISARHDFSRMKYKDSRFQPKLYRKIAEFLKKSLSISTVSRWGSMELLMQSVEELIQLSDVEGAFVYDSFQYNSGCFIGRKDEIEKIHEKLSNHQLVFLSGIGGIGKTEIARKYAQVYRKHYGTIVFSVFESSIKNLVNYEISVNGIEQEKEEDAEKFFGRKLGVLKELLTPEDLIIIDNFDVDFDENIERIFECPCKFIVTTREDFRDYNYPQIIIDKMESMDEVLQLFEAYNTCSYSDSEWKAVEQIVHLADSHTMTVELIAKYLRDTMESPIVLYERFLEKEGLANTEEINVKQRKDSRLRAESINNHIRILFDVSNFTLVQEELIRSLSLLGSIRIAKEKFLELCNVENAAVELDSMIRRGWIEYNEISGKITLHQIIQDLIYNDLKPNAENCPHIVESMKDYLNANAANYSERQVKRKVLDIFMERVTGDSLSYAALCLLYGEEKSLEEAETICLKSSDRKAFDILQKIYRKKIEYAAKCSDVFETDLDWDDYYNSKFAEVAGMIDKVIYFCKKYSEEPEYIAKTYVEAGIEADEFINEGTWGMANDKRIKELDNVYFKITDMFETATKNIFAADFTPSEKEKILKKIQSFYSGEDLFPTYRRKYFMDMEKALWYQEQINDLRKDTCGENASGSICIDGNVTYFYRDDVTNSTLASEYEEKGDYEKAMELFEKAYTTGEEDYEWTFFCLARVCKKAGKIEKAIGYLQCILNRDKENEKNDAEFFSYTSYACCELIRILVSQNRFTEAGEYAYELIHYNELEIGEEDNAYYVSWIIAAYYQLFVIESEPQQKKSFWEQCMKYYKMLEQEKYISDNIYDFVFAFVKNIDVSEKGFVEILSILKRVDNWEGEKITRDILEYAIRICESNHSYGKWHVYFLTKYSALLNKSSNQHYAEALQYCKMAQEFYDAYKLQEPYCQNLIYKVMAECMSNIREYEFEQVQKIRKKCDYALLAEADVNEIPCSDEEKIEAWKNAADTFRYIDDYERERYCLQRAYDIIMPILNQYEFSDYRNVWDIAEAMIQCYMNLKNDGQAYFMIEELYTKTIDYYDDPEKAEDTGEWSWKIKQLAEYLEEINRVEEAANLYLYAMYVAICAKPDSGLIRDMDLGEQQSLQLYKKLETIMKGGVENDVVDTVLDLKEKVMPLLKQITNGKMFQELLQWFLAKYQHQEIEFKRE